MRYSIFGFNQEELLQYDIDMTDVLLLDYIQKALSQPSMSKAQVNFQPYVWLQHAKILEDLPILNIKESMLKKRIANLVSCGLIASVNSANTSGRGSRTYYTITEKFEKLQNTTTDKKLPLVERAGVKNYPSDNKLKKDNKSISKDIEEHSPNFNFGKSNKVPKQSLYDKCVNLIDDFTDDAILRELLVHALKLFLENSKESGAPFYTNTFKGKLNKLKELSISEGIFNNYTARKIVKQTIDNGWNGFYELKSNKSNKNNSASDAGRTAKRMTAEEKKQFKEDIASGKLEKF